MSTFNPKEIKCQHGLQCRHFVSQKQGGRIFYRCHLPIGDANRCSFFKWDDELEAENKAPDQHLPPTPPSVLPNPPSTPAQTQKRTYNQSFSDEPEPSPLGQKRVRIMEAHMKQDEDPVPQMLPIPPQPPLTPMRPLSQRSSFNFGSQYRTPLRGIAEAGPSRRNDDGPPFGSQETMAGDEEELNSDNVRDLLARLANLPDYVKKLERKKLAAERSRDIKAKKITDLEQENANLKSRLGELEELVAILESES